MTFKFKIFEESNKGPASLQEEMNDFFNDKKIRDCVKKIISVNTVTERVDNTDYKSIVVCYEEEK